MASAYSILRNYGDYIQPYDLGLVQQGLQYKQGKYDVNRLKVDQQIEQFANLDLIKGVDKQYLNDRLSELVNQVNQYGTMDLSENGITKNIGNHIKQALDNNVINAYASSNEFKKTFSTIEDVKKNRPKDYAIQNEYRALQGVNEYLANPEVGASYKSKGYTPYVDVSAFYEDRIKNAEKYLPNVYKRTQIGSKELGLDANYFVDQEGKVIPPEKIRNLIRASTTPQISNQISIDANYNMRGIGRDKLIEAGTEFYSSQIKELTDLKKSAEIMLAGMDKKNENYKNIEEQIDLYGSTIGKLNTTINDIDKSDLNELRYKLHYQDVEDSYVRTYSGILEQSTTIRENSIPLRILDYNEKIKQNNIQNNFERERIALQKDDRKLKISQLELDALTKGYKLNPQTGQFDFVGVPGGTMGVDGTGLNIAGELTPDKNGNNEKSLYTNTNTAKEELKNDLVSQATKDIQSGISNKDFMAKYGSYKSDFNPENSGTFVSNFMTKMQNGYDDKLGNVSPQLKSKYDKYNYYLGQTQKVNSNNEETLIQSFDTIIDGIYNNDENKAKLNMLVPNIVIKKDGKNTYVDWDTNNMRPLSQVYGNSSSALNKEIGNTGVTYRDALYNQLGAAEIQRLMENDFFGGSRATIEDISNFLRKRVSGAKDVKRREDSDSFYGRLASKLGGGLKMAWNILEGSSMFGTEEDVKDFNEGFNSLTKPLSSQTVNFIDDIINDESNYRKASSGRNTTTTTNPLRNLMEGNKATTFNKYNPFRELYQTLDPRVKEDSALKFLDKQDLKTSINNLTQDYQSYMDNAYELGKIKNKAVYDETVGYLPQNYSKAVSTTSDLGKTLQTIIDAKMRQDGEKVEEVVGKSVEYAPTPEGGMKINFNYGSTKDNESKEIVLSAGEVPSFMKSILPQGSYNPVYDGRINKTPVSFSTTMARNPEEKMNIAAKNNLPINQVYGQQEFLSDMQNAIPPQYRNEFNQQYGRAIKYITDNPTTTYMEYNGNQLVQKVKVGNVVVGGIEIGKNYLFDEEVSSFNGNGQSNYFTFLKDLVKNYSAGKTDILDVINEELNQK